MMSSSVRKMKRLFRRESDISPTHRESLERELLARHESTYGAQSRLASSRPSVRLRTVWVVVILMIVVGVPAIPGDYALPVGSLMIWEIPASSGVPAVSEVLGRLEKSEAADEISVSVNRRGVEGATLYLILLGEEISIEEIVQLLREQQPELAHATVRSEQLVGHIRSTLAARLGRKLFSLQVSSEDMVEARRQVLEALASKGFADSRVVIVPTESGKEIRIELEEAGTPPPNESD